MVRVFVPVVPVFLVHCRTGKVDTGIPTETNAHAIPNTNSSPSPNPTDPTAVFFYSVHRHIGCCRPIGVLAPLSVLSAVVSWPIAADMPMH